MKVNAVYFVNTIDAHLAKVCGESWSFESRSFEEACEQSFGLEFSDADRRSANAKRRDRWEDADYEEDEFAVATVDDKEFQRAVEKAVEYRDAVAHNLYYEGDLENGEIELSDHVAELFAMIDSDVEDSTEFCEGFNRIESAMRKQIDARWKMRSSFGGLLLKVKLYDDQPEFEGFDYDLVSRVWDVNEIRNRYVHTGRLTDDERAFCEAVAADLYTTF